MSKDLKSLSTRGQRLWRSLTALDVLSEAELEIAWEAARAADRLERLESAAAQVVVPSSPVAVAASRHAELLADLLAALRLPDQHGRRRQRRLVRGFYPPRAF